MLDQNRDGDRYYTVADGNCSFLDVTLWRGKWAVPSGHTPVLTARRQMGPTSQVGFCHPLLHSATFALNNPTVLAKVVFGNMIPKTESKTSPNSFV